MKQPHKFRTNLNTDTASAADISTTNDKLVDYMINDGEFQAAEQITRLITDQDGADQSKQARNPAYGKLLITNNKILETLHKMHADMYDEQDTSIKKVSTAADTRMLNNANGGITKQETQDEDIGSLGFGGFPDLLRRSRKAPAAKAKASAKNDPKGKGKRKGKKTARNARTARKVSKSAIGKIGKNALRLARVAGPIGLIIGAGIAVYDGIGGWERAAENLGKTEEELTIANKAASSAGAVISGLTFGLAEEEDAAQGINNLIGGNDVIEKYEDLGIIDHDVIGDSEIDDWKKLSELPANEIQKIININDWGEEDATRMIQLHHEATVRAADIAATQQSNATETEKSLGEDTRNFDQAITNIDTAIQKQKEIIDSSVNADELGFAKSELTTLEKTKERIIIQKNNEVTVETKKIEYNNYVTGPRKTSEVLDTEEDTLEVLPDVSKHSSNNVQTSPETNKTPKESVVDNYSKNLSSQTSTYDSSINSSQVQQLVAPIINSNINNTEKQNYGEDRLLNLFTR